jgi:hypothetical protein
MGTEERFRPPDYPRGWPARPGGVVHLPDPETGWSLCGDTDEDVDGLTFARQYATCPRCLA